MKKQNYADMIYLKYLVLNDSTKSSLHKVNKPCIQKQLQKMQSGFKPDEWSILFHQQFIAECKKILLNNGI
jgi:hypothetical protein